MHFNGRFVVNLAQFAERLGGNMATLVEMTGEPLENLCREDCRLGPDPYNRVVEEAVAMTGDPYFGLHAGENLNLQAAGLIVQIAHSSATVKQALEYACEFANLGCSALATHLEQTETGYRLRLIPNPDWVAQSPTTALHTLYGFLAFSIREFQSITRNEESPKAVHLVITRPDDPSELERVMGCPVLFGQKENAILFSTEQINQPVVTSDYDLLTVLVAHAQKKLASMKANEGFYQRVKQSVVVLIKPQFPTIDQVAGHLNMSVRTFQRKLRAEGHSYKSLLDDLRQEFARDYLTNAELSISEVAYLLNYADASAFTRSFKRWTGVSPKEFRKNSH